MIIAYQNARHSSAERHVHREAKERQEPDAALAGMVWSVEQKLWALVLRKAVDDAEDDLHQARAWFLLGHWRPIVVVLDLDAERVEAWVARRGWVLRRGERIGDDSAVARAGAPRIRGFAALVLGVLRKQHRARYYRSLATERGWPAKRTYNALNYLVRHDAAIYIKGGLFVARGNKRVAEACEVNDG